MRASRSPGRERRKSPTRSPSLSAKKRRAKSPPSRRSDSSEPAIIYARGPGSRSPKKGTTTRDDSPNARIVRRLALGTELSDVAAGSHLPGDPSVEASHAAVPNQAMIHAEETVNAQPATTSPEFPSARSALRWAAPILVLLFSVLSVLLLPSLRSRPSSTVGLLDISEIRKGQPSSYAKYKETRNWLEGILAPRKQ